MEQKRPWIGGGGGVSYLLECDGKDWESYVFSREKEECNTRLVIPRRGPAPVAGGARKEMSSVNNLFWGGE